ncbi:hypothetical protein G6K97_21635 [Agrobacterium rhizogenes]|uniref:hypothetical protein n=1 Tax=Rhizobium rhizogenes TaxID=359 RepID=UPI001571865F|nr:hypothetical protein [Rhizobium rhizogenes]NTG02960.1 hypothetical protein [Rhizobium rhizogenes]NTG10023.1 hypothetical protein [Rhizobium rhizogenes]NTH79768.1 hypothetical protein [Rhizobium rhizogenes]NTH85745.1 hypothetical protein [Rhizobium rhizogenes]
MYQILNDAGDVLDAHVEFDGTEEKPVLCYMYQDKNHQTVRDIEPSDPDLALASFDRFQRMMRRLEQWRKQKG